MFSIAACILVALALFILVVLFATEKLALADELIGSVGSLLLLAAVVIGSIGGGLLFELLINPVRARTLCEATFADARSLGNHLLVLRGIDDEAALSLAAGAVTNRVLRIAYSFSLRLMFPFSKLDASTIGGQLWAYFGPLSLIVGLSCILFGPYITFVGLTVMFVSTGLSLFFIPLTRTVFGRALAFGAISCAAAFDSVPDSELATIITLGLRKDETFSHALYEHPLAAPTIANWIAGHVLGGSKELRTRSAAR